MLHRGQALLPRLKGCAQTGITHLIGMELGEFARRWTKGAQPDSGSIRGLQSHPRPGTAVETHSDPFNWRSQGPSLLVILWPKVH